MSDPDVPARIVPQPDRASATRPVVTICCITYNHERFIAQALEGFLAQRTNFPVEIIVHDDHSTDDTANIVRRFQAANPGRIRAVLRDQNQYALGRKIMPMFADWVDSEFIALCEGDDYWTDPEKLQLQIDHLRAFPGAAGCFHDSVIVDGEGNIVANSYFSSQHDRFTQRDVISDLLSREPTCSLVFRTAVMARPLPTWYLRRPSDLYLDLLVTEQGELHFLRRNMAAYRRHSTGTWSSARHARQVSELILRLQLLKEDPGFNSRYSSLLASRIMEFHELLFTREDFDAELARLTSIVEEQSIALASIDRERDRLTAEAKAAQAEAKRAAKEGQKYIDALTAQLSQLAATSAEQTKHIKVLEGERDRLTAEGKKAHAEAKRAAKEGQKHIDALSAQAARASSEGQSHIDALKTQLDQLAATSREQSGYIGALEKERHRLSAELAELQKKAADYVAVMKEQSDYIRTLEVARDQTAGKST